jgi:threonine synthase
MPRVFGVQAENCAPYFAAYQAGGDTLVDTEVKATIAEGIASSKPTRVKEVLHGVRDSGGSIVAVSEAEIVDALRGLARKGLYVEPTSAAGAAGLTQLIATGAVKPDETTVLVLTGSGLKASERIGDLLGLHARTV